MLVDEGYSGLTTQNVAERAGSNKALIQYYFGSKDGLVETIAEQLGERVLSLLERALSQDVAVEEMVDTVVEEMWEFFHGAADLQRIYFDLSAQSVGNEPLRAKLREVREKYRSLLIDRIESLNEDGTTKKQRSSLATFFMATFDGLALELVQSGDSPELQGALDLFKLTAVMMLLGDVEG